MADLKSDVRVFQDLEALSHAAAALFTESSGQAVGERGRFLVALSGGRTPLRLYELLAQAPYREQVDWACLHAFWGDERCVPAEDLMSNYRLVQDVLLAHVPVPAENVHRVRTELEPELAAQDYSRQLRRFASSPLIWPRFDLVLLGLGLDGHTASLFPHSPVDTAEPTLAVSAPPPARPPWRVTLTPAVINTSRRIVFLISGSGKSRVLASVLYGEHNPQTLPAQRIRPADGDLIWMLDRRAAASP